MPSKSLWERMKGMASFTEPENQDAADVGADITAGFIPGVSTAQGFRDMGRAVSNRSPVEFGLAALGTIPEVGGVIKGLRKAGQYVADFKNLPIDPDELFKFRTSKGSVYQHRKGNTTVRDKHERIEQPGEYGVQPPSTKTIYMEPRATNVVGSWLQDPNIPTRMIPELDAAGKPTGKVIVQVMEDFNHRTLGPLKKGQVVSRVPYEINPQVGLNPIEIYGHAESPIGSKARNVHFGNEITEVIPGLTTMPNNYRAGGRVRMI